MIKNVLIVAPNAGVSMSYGGGCKVAVEMAEALLENGIEVGLVAFHGLPPDRLDKIHGTNLQRFGKKLRTYYFLNSSSIEGGILREFVSFLPTYFGVIPLIITRHLKHVLSIHNSSFIIFHDDMPVNVGDLDKRKAILYCHFPMAAITKIGDTEEREVEQSLRKGMRLFLKTFLKRAIVIDNPHCKLLLANSSITKRYMESTWNRYDVLILYPSVDTNTLKYSTSKEDLIVSIGSIQPNKRLGDLIVAVSKVKFNCKCIIIGYLRDRNYYNYLMKSITRLRLEEKIIIKPNVSHDYIINTLSKAKILVHTARFEPFGVAVIEGMASGCVPIVYEGEKSGPWIDIVKKGEYGLGFQKIEELAENMERILSDEKLFHYYSNKAIKRAKSFDVQVFKKKFMELVENIDCAL